MAVKVSIIVACFNVAKHLERAVKSVREEVGLTWEMHLIDDHSTDQTLQTAKSLAAEDKRVIVHALPCNAGPSAARNVGLRAATGQWLAILDADDAFEPGRLAGMLAYDQDSDLIFDNLLLWDEAAQCSAGTALPWQERRDFHLSDLINSESPRSKQKLGYLKPLIRRDFLTTHSVSYNESLRLAEDFDLYARLLLNHARAIFVPSPSYIYTLQLGTVSKRKSSGTRTKFTPEVRVALGEKLISDFAGRVAASDHKLLARYLEWQKLYDAVHRLGGYRQSGEYGAFASQAVSHPRAFARYGISLMRHRLRTLRVG